MHASHPAPSSTSGGRLVLTRRLVLAIAHLSNPEIRVASASTNASSSHRQGAINVTVSLGLICSDVFRAQEHFEGAVSTDESGKPSHGAASGDHSHTHLPLRDDGLLAAGKAHVAGQRDLAAVAGRTAADEGDGRDRQAVRRTRKSGQGGKPVVPSGSEVRSSILAVKSE